MQCRAVEAMLSVSDTCALKIIVDCPLNLYTKYTAYFKESELVLTPGGGEGEQVVVTNLKRLMNQDVVRAVATNLAARACRALVLLVTTVTEEAKQRVIQREGGEVIVYYPAVVVVELPHPDALRFLKYVQN